MRFQAIECPFLIRTHQARIPGHVSGENGGKATGNSHFGFYWASMSQRNIRRELLPGIAAPVR